MTIRNNGQKRDVKRVLSALFLLVVGLVCLVIAYRNDWKWSWDIISIAILYLSFAMFRSSNEV
ncbi:MAG: hypothetical protein IJJ21_03560 [Firmicutes bacterium]|nr:hypothetical protein [Bacillota bacterium]